METRKLGKTDIAVSVLGFGSAPIGFLKTDPAEATRLLNKLLDAGINVIDTAAMYHGAEEMIGQAIGHRRDDYVLVSKCGTKILESSASPFAPELIVTTVERALKRLRTDVLDIMLLHSCDLKTLEAGDALAALVKLRDAGKIKHVGYSGDNEAAAFAVALPEVAVLETSINIADQRNIDTVLPLAVKHNVGVIVKRPIANAAWKDIKSQQGMYQNYAKTYTDRLAKMELDPASLGFQGDASEAWPELALRFTLSQPGVHTAIVGSTNEANVLKNIEYTRHGALPDQVIQRIRDVFDRADRDRTWTGQQ